MAHARDIRVIVSDVDGVWTDGKIIYAGDRSELKNFNVRDGLGAKLVQRVGIQIVLLTSRSSPALARRARELSITELHQGATNKAVACAEILESMALTFDQALYLGDDFPDLAVLRLVGLPVAVGNAVPEIRAACKLHLARLGGAGAIREFAETLLKARGDWERVTQRYVAERSIPSGGAVV
jgi:3-deoxy-D-manno-octulosonate 8-phosphate phosphatase (KDO 8-P phosphatase)